MDAALSASITVMRSLAAARNLYFAQESLGSINSDIPRWSGTTHAESPHSVRKTQRIVVS
jgi:hypothetical protein